MNKLNLQKERNYLAGIGEVAQPKGDIMTISDQILKAQQALKLVEQFVSKGNAKRALAYVRMLKGSAEVLEAALTE